MNGDLLQKLKDWRRKTANLEGVEPFRVFANKVLENITEMRPTNKEELMAIKGIRDRKFAKYGEKILTIINDSAENSELSNAPINDQSQKPLSISEYLGFLNRQLNKCRARIQGEISSADIREKVVYFSLKDSEDESVINCLLWKSDYELYGINFEVGMEVVIEGAPDIYKPSGRLTFKASSVELVGEGVLKKAYDQLKNKLEAEGLFLEERKKEIPIFPQKIGLITSETGAVIHDFLTNLGRYGFHIEFIDSRVEGQVAVQDLISSIDYFEQKDIDVLVIIRGGGSLESLQAFNNETLARKIANFNKPVICGIGHDRDVPLASLAADLMVSTPTATTIVLNKSWEKALDQIRVLEQDLLYKYQCILADKNLFLERSATKLKEGIELIFRRFRDIKYRLSNKVEVIAHGLKDARKSINSFQSLLLSTFQNRIDWLKSYLYENQKRLQVVDPKHQLKLGYSIASNNGKIIRSIEQVKQGDEVDILVSDGQIKSQVNNIK